MRITKKPFGRINNQDIYLYSLVNNNGMKAEIMDYGGIIVSLHAPDRDGNLKDITLGFDSFEDYTRPHPFFGAIIGRHANRLEDASFTINDVFYELNSNEETTSSTADSWALIKSMVLRNNQRFRTGKSPAEISEPGYGRELSGQSGCNSNLYP